MGSGMTGSLARETPLQCEALQGVV